MTILTKYLLVRERSMPYIDSKDREEVINCGALNAGQLNYQITMVLTEYLRKKGLKYQIINDILGALEGAKLEFYRRAVIPYEDMKKDLNGDVYRL